MEVTITRDDVMHALDVERLTVGSWEQDGCAFCAVGSVLRQKTGVKLLKDRDEESFDSACRNMTRGQYCDDQGLPQALAAGNWLGALSIKWEQLGTKKASELGRGCVEELEEDEIEELRPAIKQWALDNLPEGVIFEGGVV